MFRLWLVEFSGVVLSCCRLSRFTFVVVFSSPDVSFINRKTCSARCSRHLIFLFIVMLQEICEMCVCVCVCVCVVCVCVYVYLCLC